MVRIFCVPDSASSIVLDISLASKKVAVFWNTYNLISNNKLIKVDMMHIFPVQVHDLCRQVLECFSFSFEVSFFSGTCIIHTRSHTACGTCTLQDSAGNI